MSLIRSDLAELVCKADEWHTLYDIRSAAVKINRFSPYVTHVGLLLFKKYILIVWIFLTCAFT